MTALPVLNARPVGRHRIASIEEHILNYGEQCQCRLHRLASYREWPHLRTHSACDFTDAGFYYEGRDDAVKCASCGLTLAQWTSGVHPLAAHRTLCTCACQFVGHRIPANNLPHADGAEATAATVSQSDDPFVSSFCKPFAGLSLPPFIGLTDLLNVPTVDDQVSSFSATRGRTENQLVLPRPREEALKCEAFRLSTFFGVWEYTSIIDPRELARAAFYYVGPRDRVQCAFCQGLLRNWEPGDRAATLHAQHFTYCRFVQGHDVGNVPVPFSALEQSWPEHEGTGVKVLGIASSTPQNVDLAVEARRLATFATWPLAHPLKPDDLAAAGFFYIGGQESVKCFYCGVVISSWPTGSDAWVEHAKQSSSCLFLEQVKGIDFVQQHRIVSSGADESSSQAPFRVDPREVRARLDSSKVQILLHMDYPIDLIRETIQKRLSTHNDDHVSSEDLLSSIFELHDERQRTRFETFSGRPERSAILPVVITHVDHHSPGVSLNAALLHSSSAPALPTNAERAAMHHHSAAEDAPPLSSSLSALLTGAELHRPLPLAGAEQGVTPTAAILKPPGAEEENRQLKTQLTCKICMDSLVGIVFLPCGHFVCCPACAPALNACPICRVSIRGTVRTYL